MLITKTNVFDTCVFVQSFRFGAEIAYVAATILAVCKRVQKLLVGGKQKGKYLSGNGGFFKTHDFKALEDI